MCQFTCIGAVATIILAENAEVVKVFVVPIKEELEHEVELGQRGALRTRSLRQMRGLMLATIRS